MQLRCELKLPFLPRELVEPAVDAVELGLSGSTTRSLSPLALVASTEDTVELMATVEVEARTPGGSSTSTSQSTTAVPSLSRGSVRMRMKILRVRQKPEVPPAAMDARMCSLKTLSSRSGPARS